MTRSRAATGRGTAMMDRRPSARVPISARPAALHDRPDPAGGQQVQDLARMQPGDLEARRAQRVQLVAEPGTGTQVRRLQQGRVLRRAQRPGRADRHSGVVRERRDVDRLRQLAVGHTVQGDAAGRTDRRVPGEADGLGVEHPDGALDGPLRAAGQPHRDRIGVQLAGRMRGSTASKSAPACSTPSRRGVRRAATSSRKEISYHRLRVLAADVTGLLGGWA